MSIVDYGQTVEDHQSLLVLVRHTGSHLPTNLFNRMWERIRALNIIHVQGQNRNVVVRYKRGYPVANNEWGDFQAHRKVLGLISVGKCVDHEEFGILFENYKKVKEEYASTIINSRLIIFGMNTDGSPIEGKDDKSHPSRSPQQFPTGADVEASRDSVKHQGQGECMSENEAAFSELKSLVEDMGGDVNNTVIERLQSEKVSDEGTRQEQYSLNGRNVQRDINLNDCTLSSGQNNSVETNSELLSKKKNGTEAGSQEHTALQDDVFDSAQNVESSRVKSVINNKDLDTKGSCDKRPHSNSLTKESTGSEVVFYPGIDQCMDLEDRLKEFITSLFFVLEGKRLERSFERNDRLVLLCAPFEKKDYIGVDTDTKSFKRKCMGRLRKHLGDLCLQASLPGEAILHYQTALDLLRTVNDFLWMGACYEGLCASSVIMTYPRSNPIPLRRNLSFSVKRGSSSPDLKNRTAASIRSQTNTGSFSNGLDHIEGSALHCLDPEDIIEKYKEAILNYSKYKNVAMIEMEASLKACRVLIYQKKYLQASDFLQNVVYINLQSSEDDKIDRFTTLSSLYGQAGFHRKEAFFKRVAAMQCVSPATKPAWHQCYQLLLQAVSGFNINLDPRESKTGHPNGWPVIQHKVMNELVFSARRMGNPQLAVRHMTLLLHTIYPYMMPAEQKEAVNNLENLTTRCQGIPQPLSTETGLILPPVHLTTLPTVKSFKPLSPPPHLRPIKIFSESDSPGKIFIYTPLSLGHSDRKGNSPTVDFLWVADDMCEVQVMVVNPLSIELHLLYMAPLTEGPEVEVFPASLVIPPNSPPLLIKLIIKPRTSGQLKIMGYSTQVLGVRSHCRLRDLAISTPPYFEIECVPPLPQVTLICSLPKAASFAPSISPESAAVVTNVSALLYAGQSQDCVVTLHNISSHVVSTLDVKLDVRSDVKESTDKIFEWSKENIISQLPIHSSGQLCFTVRIYGYSDYLLPPVTSPDMSSSPLSSQSQTESLEIRGTHTVEAVLTIQYSGGPGLDAGFCRRCSLALTVDVLPSIYITNWDALPSNSGQEVSLMLELLNASNHQVDIHYGSGAGDNTQLIIIESQQSRRIAVTIPRIVFPEPNETEKFESHVPDKYRVWRAPDVYSQYLENFVDIRWSMPADKATGKVSIQHLRWTQPQLDVICVPVISWEVTLNEHRYVAPDLMHFSAGQTVIINITMSSTQGADVYRDLCLTLEPTQGDTQKQVESDVFFCLGSQTLFLSELQPGSHLHHSCSLVFLCAGHYSLHITCSCHKINSAADLTWRCLPVPEFTVEE